MEENYRILKPYLRGLPLIIFGMILAFLMAKKYLNYVTPQYESTTKLRLADVSDGVPSSNLFKDLDVFTTSNKIAAEIEILKSDVLLEKVMNELDFNLEVFRNGKIKTVELYDQSPIEINYTIKNKSAYDVLFELKVLNDFEFDLTIPGSTQSIKGRLGDTLELPDVRFVISKNNAILLSKPHIPLTDNYSFQILSRHKLLSKIKSNLDIIAVDEDVAVVRINYQSPNPLKASVLANKLAQVYILDYIENKYKAANITVEFLKDQINQVLSKLSYAENNIQAFRDKKGITNIYQETETDLRKIAQLKIQESNLKMNLEAMKDLEKYITDGKENFLELAPNFEAFTDLLSTEIVKQIKTLQAEKRDLLVDFTPNDEKVKVIDDKIKDLTSYLAESISNTRKNLEIKCNQISDYIFEAEKVFEGIPEKERVLKVLDREFMIYQQSYNFLNEKMIEAEIAQAARIAFHRIITYAQVPTMPISPNRIIVTSISTILGMFLMILFIYIIHIVKAKVNDRQTIESSSLTPIAMLIPRFNDETMIDNYFLKEVVQLEIKGLLKNKAIICISSFSHETGTYFNALNIAKALSYQNRKVLFVDTANTMNYENTTESKKVNIGDDIDLITLSDLAFNRYTKDGMQLYFKSFEDDYDVIIILNEKMGVQKSILLMSIATLNLVILDTRLTPDRRIVEADLLKEEYNLPSVNFVLNRFGYNPNVFVELLAYFKKLKCAPKTNNSI